MKTKVGEKATRKAAPTGKEALEAARVIVRAAKAYARLEAMLFRLLIKSGGAQ